MFEHYRYRYKLEGLSWPDNTTIHPFWYSSNWNRQRFVVFLQHLMPKLYLWSSSSLPFFLHYVCTQASILRCITWTHFHSLNLSRRFAMLKHLLHTKQISLDDIIYDGSKSCLEFWLQTTLRGPVDISSKMQYLAFYWQVGVQKSLVSGYRAPRGIRILFTQKVQASSFQIDQRNVVLRGQIRGHVSVCAAWNALPNNVEHKVEAFAEFFKIQWK